GGGTSGARRSSQRRLRLASTVPLAGTPLRLVAVLAAAVAAAATVLVPAAAGGRSAGAAQVAHTYQDGGMIGFGSVSLSDPPVPQPLQPPVFSGPATPG